MFEIFLTFENEEEITFKNVINFQVLTQDGKTYLGLGLSEGIEASFPLEDVTEFTYVYKRVSNKRRIL